jgi:hypothetical protein
MTTATQVQVRRGTASQVAAFTGAQGELVVDTTNNRVVVQDGATAGGFAAAKLTDLPTISRTPVNDANYTALTTDRIVAYAAITAARVVLLPAASGFPAGVRMTVVDESGSVTGSHTITLTPNGTDKINGAGTQVINTAYGYLGIESNGAGEWTIVDAPTTLTASRTPVSNANYTALVTDLIIAYTSITAARTVTLPASNTFPTGVRLTVVDESAPTNSITLARAGSDTINGASSAAIKAPYGFLTIESNGSNAWTIIDQDMNSWIANLPTSLPGSTGVPWNDSGVISTT